MANILDKEDGRKQAYDRAYEIYLQNPDFKKAGSRNPRPKKINPNDTGTYDSDEEGEYCIINGKRYPVYECEPERKEEPIMEFKDAKNFKDSLGVARLKSANWDELTDEEKEEFWKFMKYGGRERGYDEYNIDE